MKNLVQNRSGVNDLLRILSGAKAILQSPYDVRTSLQNLFGQLGGGVSGMTWKFQNESG